MGWRCRSALWHSHEGPCSNSERHGNSFSGSQSPQLTERPCLCICCAESQPKGIRKVGATSCGGRRSPATADARVSLTVEDRRASAGHRPWPPAKVSANVSTERQHRHLGTGGAAALGRRQGSRQAPYPPILPLVPAMCAQFCTTWPPAPSEAVGHPEMRAPEAWRPDAPVAIMGGQGQTPAIIHGLLHGLLHRLTACPHLQPEFRRGSSSKPARAPWRNRTSINRLKAGCSAVELKGLGWIVGGAPSRLSCTIAQWPVP